MIDPSFAGFEDLVQLGRTVYPETFALSAPSAGELLDGFIDGLAKQSPDASFAAHRARNRPIWFWAAHWTHLMSPVIDVSRDVGVQMLAAPDPSPSFARELAFVPAYLVRFAADAPYFTPSGARVDHLLVSHEAQTIFLATHTAGVGIGFTSRCTGDTFEHDAPEPDRASVQALWKIARGVQTALIEMTNVDQPTEDGGFDPMELTRPKVYVLEP